MTERSTYASPDHPLEPEPPTFWNRLRCRALGHFFTADTIDYPLLNVSLVCLRCSRTLVVPFPNATLKETFTSTPPRAVQH